MSWRTTLGEAGTLLSPRVVCSVEAANALKPVEHKIEEPLSSSTSPGLQTQQLTQGQVYTAKCSLTNNSDKDLWLQVSSSSSTPLSLCFERSPINLIYDNLPFIHKPTYIQVQFHLESMQGIYVTGKSFQNAGLVQAHTKKTMTFQLLPLMAGLHEIKGVSIVDLVSSQEFPQSKIGEFLVIKKGESEDEPLVHDLHSLSLTSN